MKKADFKNAKWIFTEDNKKADSKIVIRKKFTVGKIPDKATALIAAETKYWLCVNGQLAVYEGGVFRESLPGCGYADEVDIAPYLKEGENTLAVLVLYYGNAGRNNVDSGEGGFIFACDALGLYSGESFLAAPHPAYVPTSDPHPAYLYGGENTGFDARLDFGDFTAEDFDDSAFSAAVEYENKVWGDSFISPLPLKYYHDLCLCEYSREGDITVAPLPCAMTFSAYIECEASGGEVIDIRSDRYNINGGPGDEFHSYNGHRIEYTCREGENLFLCPMYLYGEKMLVSAPEGVKIKALGYRESGYATDVVGSFVTEDPLFNRLIEKSIRTLYVCMRDNFMDCPDRERGQWIGDVTVQAPQVFYIFDSRAVALLKKAVSDFINLRKGDVLCGNVPGVHFSELPSQSLVAIGRFGFISEYYHFSRDAEAVSEAFLPIMNYLRLWSLDERGLILPRQGNWRWFDHLFNVDEDVLENCLYVSALSQALEFADICGNHEHDSFLKERIETISAAIEENFWKGEYYSSGRVVDDRANAIAVLSGVCPAEHYPAIRKILLTVFNSTPYMERFVLVALCEMGYIPDAVRRMNARYYNLATNENSTLWEDFYILGTKNHAWSGSPVEIAFKYILGLRTEDGFKSYTVSPEKDIFSKIDCSFNLDGKTEHISVKDGKVIK